MFASTVSRDAAGVRNDLIYWWVLLGPVTLWAGIMLLIQQSNRDKGKTLTSVYECLLNTDTRKIIAFATADKSFADSVAETINQRLRKYSTPPGRHTSAARRSQRSTQ